MRETPANVGAALQNAMRGIEAANQKHLYDVFGDTQWSNKDRCARRCSNTSCTRMKNCSARRMGTSGSIAKIPVTLETKLS